MIISNSFCELWRLLPDNAVARLMLRHPDSHFHPEFVFKISKKRASQRRRLSWIARDRHADKVAPANQAIGRIEFDPARARQINLAPGVRRAAPNPQILSVVIARHIDVARDEARGDAERAGGFHHENGE